MPTLRPCRVGVDEWEALQETLFWLSEPDLRESVAKARDELTEDESFDETQIRTQFAVPPSTE